MEQIIAALQTYMNIKAVICAVVGTQIIKWFLPPESKELTTWWDRFTVRSGPILNRAVPILPVLIAFVVCYFVEKDSSYTWDDAVHGISSGAIAGYLYRTTKTLIFGE
jgi:hypothetical protein